MDLTRQLKGKEVAYVATQGDVLLIFTNDGDEIAIAWVDEQGVSMKGRPIIRRRGKRLFANPKDLVLVPQAAR